MTTKKVRRRNPFYSVFVANAAIQFNSMAQASMDTDIHQYDDINIKPLDPGVRSGWRQKKFATVICFVFVANAAIQFNSMALTLMGADIHLL